MNETYKVIYRHPKGRYIVIERSGECRLGGKYHIREVVYPRPKPQPMQPTKAIRVTEREKVRFAKLYRKGYSIKKIAEMSGWSDTSVRRHLSRMGLIREQKKLTDSEKAQIKNLAQNGVTCAKIAEAIGVS